MSPSLTFEKVAECLYRNPSSATYYALVKVKGKQFKKSLKTIDLAKAKRKLRDSFVTPVSKSLILSFVSTLNPLLSKRAKITLPYLDVGLPTPSMGDAVAIVVIGVGVAVDGAGQLVEGVVAVGGGDGTLHPL